MIQISPTSSPVQGRLPMRSRHTDTLLAWTAPDPRGGRGMGTCSCVVVAYEWGCVSCSEYVPQIELRQIPARKMSSEIQPINLVPKKTERSFRTITGSASWPESSGNSRLPRTCSSSFVGSEPTGLVEHGRRPTASLRPASWLRSCVPTKAPPSWIMPWQIVRPHGGKSDSAIGPLPKCTTDKEQRRSVSGSNERGVV